jgi:uncharacterized protein (TIGR02466 family)
LQNKSEGRQYSNRGGWQSEDVVDDPNMSTFISKVEDKSESLRKYINYKSNIRLKVEGIWININHPYCYNSIHTHPGSYMSGVYYVKAPKKSGDLIFKHPSVLQALYIPNDIIEHNEATCSKWFVEPEESKILFFPSWVEHEVGQNLSEEDRISIAFNLIFVDENNNVCLR